MKGQGKKMIGLDPFPITEAVKIKQKLKARFDQDRANGTPEGFGRGCCLFVNGEDVMP